MSRRCLEGVWKLSGLRLEGGWKLLGRCFEGSWKVSGRCLENDWKVTSHCPTSPTQLGTNFYLELEFDSGADPACYPIFFLGVINQPNFSPKKSV